MELNERAELDTSQVDDLGRGGGSGGGDRHPAPGGGGRGGLIGIMVAVLVALVGGGFGLNAMTNGDGGGQAGDNTSLEQECAQDNAQRFEQLRLPQPALRQLDPGLLAGRATRSFGQARTSRPTPSSSRPR